MVLYSATLNHGTLKIVSSSLDQVTEKMDDGTRAEIEVWENGQCITVLGVTRRNINNGE